MADDRTSVNLGEAKVSPASVFKNQGNKVSQQYLRDITNARAEGYQEGRDAARSEVIDFLQKRYMDPHNQRGSEGGVAILKITREIVELLKDKK
jgi:hypothetical protein